MKKILLALTLVALGASAYAVETKKVCMDQKDVKTGKVKQVCKEVKIHKKLDATPVPTKK